MEKRTHRKCIVSIWAAVLLTVVFPVCRWRQQETGYTIIQAIIEGLPAIIIECNEIWMWMENGKTN